MPTTYLVRYEYPNGLYYDFRMDANAKITPHFKLYEVANTKGKTSIPQFVFNEKVWKFYECIEEFRVWYAKAINPTSGYRQVQYNKSVNGDAKSLHLLGLAFDWKCASEDKSNERRKLIENQWKLITMKHCLIGGCNWYTNGFHFSVYENERFGYTNFVHRDYRGVKGKDW